MPAKKYWFNREMEMNEWQAFKQGRAWVPVGKAELATHHMPRISKVPFRYGDRKAPTGKSRRWNFPLELSQAACGAYAGHDAVECNMRASAMPGLVPEGSSPDARCLPQDRKESFCIDCDGEIMLVMPVIAAY